MSYASVSSSSSSSDDEDEIILEGVLEKKTTKSVFNKHLWQQRYFVLKKDVFLYYKNKEKSRLPDAKPHGRWETSEIVDLELLSSHNNCRLNVCTNKGRVLALNAANTDLRQKWYDAIQRAREGSVGIDVKDDSSVEENHRKKGKRKEGGEESDEDSDENKGKGKRDEQEGIEMTHITDPSSPITGYKGPYPALVTILVQDLILYFNYNKEESVEAIHEVERHHRRHHHLRQLPPTLREAVFYLEDPHTRKRRQKRKGREPPVIISDRGPDASGYHPDALKEGELEKKKRDKSEKSLVIWRATEWTKRYWVLTGGNLQYFRDLADKEPAQVIALTEFVEADIYHEALDKAHVANEKCCFVVSPYLDADSRLRGIRRKYESVVDWNTEEVKNSQEKEKKAINLPGHVSIKIPDMHLQNDSEEDSEEERKHFVTGLTRPTRMWILAAKNEDERRDWLVAIWKLVPELEKESAETRHLAKKKNLTPQEMAKFAAKHAVTSGANFAMHKQELLRLQESQVSKSKHSVFNWIKHKHTVLSLFYVYESEGLPRSARAYLFILDIIMNLFLTLEFGYTERETKFGPYTQSAITVAVCTTVGFLIHYTIAKINKFNNFTMKALGFVGLGLVMPLVLLGITLYYISKIGGWQAAEEIFLQFAINVMCDWATDILILFVAYFIIREWFATELDDRGIAADDLQAGKDALEKAEVVAKEHEAKSQASRVRKIKIQRKLDKMKKKRLKKGKG